MPENGPKSEHDRPPAGGHRDRASSPGSVPAGLLSASGRVDGPEPSYRDGPLACYRATAAQFRRHRAAGCSYHLVPEKIHATTDDRDADQLVPFLQIAFRRARVTAELVRRRRRAGRAREDPTRHQPRSWSRYLDHLAWLFTTLLLLSLLAVPVVLVAPASPIWLLALPPLFAAVVLVASQEFLRFAYGRRGARGATTAAGIHLLGLGAAVTGAAVGLLRGIGQGRPQLRRTAWRLLGVGFVVVLVGAVGLVLIRQDWSVVGRAIAQQDRARLWLMLGGAFVVASAGLVPAVISWGALLRGLGPPVRTEQVVRIFLVFFLGRYLPRGLGLIATFAAARTGAVTLGRLVSAMALNTVVVAATGLTIGLAASLHLFGPRGAWLILAPVLTVMLLVRPGLVNQGAHLLARLFRRPPPAGSVSPRGVRVAVAAQALSWLVSGLHLWLLAIMVGAPPVSSLALCVGAFSLAMVAGILAIVVPDGIGVREAILVGALALVLPLPSAVAVTLASRLVTTVTDLVVGAPALAMAQFAHRRHHHAGGEAGLASPHEPERSTPDAVGRTT